MKEKGEQFPQASVTVSRVLSRVDHLSRPGVAAQARAILRTRRAAACVLLRILHRMGFTARTSRQAAGELLPRLSILTGILSTFQPRLADDQREQDPCGLFLLHSPWSRLHRPLAGILPCGARTFLMPWARDRLVTSHTYLTAKRSESQGGRMKIRLPDQALPAIPVNDQVERLVRLCMDGNRIALALQAVAGAVRKPAFGCA